MSWCEHRHLVLQAARVSLLLFLCAWIKVLNMALEVSSLVEVSDRISKNTTLIQGFLTTRGLPSPSFTVNSPTEFPDPENETAIELAREAILADTKTLFDLVLGPVERLKWSVWQVLTPLCYSSS